MLLKCNPVHVEIKLLYEIYLKTFLRNVRYPSVFKTAHGNITLLKRIENKTNALHFILISNNTHIK